jgi:hypothetical protein
VRQASGRLGGNSPRAGHRDSGLSDICLLFKLCTFPLVAPLPPVIFIGRIVITRCNFTLCMPPSLVPASASAARVTKCIMQQLTDIYAKMSTASRLLPPLSSRLAMRRTDGRTDGRMDALLLHASYYVHSKPNVYFDSAFVTSPDWEKK